MYMATEVEERFKLEILGKMDYNSKDCIKLQKVKNMKQMLTFLSRVHLPETDQF